MYAIRSYYEQIESEINNYRNQLKVEHLDNLKNDVYTYDSGIIFNDLFSECEKLGDFIINSYNFV